jgi:hypothetical protein
MLALRAMGSFEQDFCGIEASSEGVWQRRRSSVLSQPLRRGMLKTAAHVDEDSVLSAEQALDSATGTDSVEDDALADLVEAGPLSPERVKFVRRLSALLIVDDPGLAALRESMAGDLAESKTVEERPRSQSSLSFAQRVRAVMARPLSRMSASSLQSSPKMERRQSMSPPSSRR